MNNRIKMLDCTLRDGAYIVDAKFGTPAIKGIIKKMQEANVEIVECGWLKNQEHEEGTSFFHVPEDLLLYMTEKHDNCVYTVMIDWDRYDLDYLPQCDGKSVDAVRVVFPYGKHKEGIAVGKEILKKGYKVYYQAANTLAYSDEDLKELASCVNEVEAEALSIVDTFGAMYEEDLERILSVLDKCLNKNIALGFHSHNNQQLSFALSIYFVNWLCNNSTREGIVDASLCGMGRGAGNATTELIANYLNRKQLGNYDLDMIMDAIDTYMLPFQQNYTWGYSTPYFIAGMYCCHVNNIAYLINNHRTCAKDMRNVIQSLSEDDRKKYDYDLLEEKYIENQNCKFDDEENICELRKKFAGKNVLLIAPGKSVLEKEKINSYIQENNPIIVDVNAITAEYPRDYIFFINKIRDDYSKNAFPSEYSEGTKLYLSNVKTTQAENEYVISFSSILKKGWKYFDNAVIYCLRLMERLGVNKVGIAGFDGFESGFNTSYADKTLPTIDTSADCEQINKDTKDMFYDIKKTCTNISEFEFVTESRFE